jgi:hypothetical protein
MNKNSRALTGEIADDVPRTSIFAHSVSGFLNGSVFIENSPLKKAENMPDVPYFIIHGHFR